MNFRVDLNNKKDYINKMKNKNNNMNKMDLIIKLLVELKEEFDSGKMNKDEKIRFDNFIYDVEDLLSNEEEE